MNSNTPSSHHTGHVPNIRPGSEGAVTRREWPLPGPVEAARDIVGVGAREIQRSCLMPDIPVEMLIEQLRTVASQASKKLSEDQPKDPSSTVMCRKILLGHGQRCLDIADSPRIDLRAAIKQLRGTADLIEAELNDAERTQLD